MIDYPITEEEVRLIRSLRMLDPHARTCIAMLIIGHTKPKLVCSNNVVPFPRKTRSTRRSK